MMDKPEQGKNSSAFFHNKGVLIAAIVLILIACCCIITGIVFSENITTGINTMIDSDSNIVFILILILSATIFLMVFPVVLIAFVQWRNTKTMDQIFEPLGLKGEAYILTGRQYHGVVNGRKIDIYILRGPTVEICCQGDIHTHFLALKAGKVHSAVLSNVREEPIRINEAGLEDFIFYGPDEPWLTRLFSDHHAVNSLDHLLSHGVEWAVIRRVEAKAGQASLTIYRSKKLMLTLALTRAEVNDLLMTLSNFVKSIESAPAPAVVEEIAEKSLEKRVRKIKPGIVALIIVLLVGIPACLMTAGFLLTLLLSGSL